MGDLEDRILKKNIPGKYTWWEKDADEAGPSARADWVDPDASDPEDEMSELDRQKQWIDTDCPEPVRRTIMARKAKERAQTGPKGVLADYNAHAASVQADEQLQQQYRNAMLRQMTRGATAQPLPTGLVPAGDADSASEAEAEADQQEFLQQFRKARLEQLKANAGRPQFGQIREVSRHEFVGAVDEEDPRVSIVVHMYEPYIKACQQMNRHLEVIAQRQPTTKFLRLQSRQADSDYDPVALPTIMLYKAKELVACLTRVTDDIGENFTQEDVEWLLQEHDIFEPTSAAPQQTSQPPAASHHEIDEDRLDSD